METLTTFETMTRNDLLANHKPLIIAGPCAIESLDQLMTIATALAEMGVQVLRANPWKPRTEFDTFQGMGEEALQWVAEVKAATGMMVAMEVVEAPQIQLTQGIADILWVGARNMQNYSLLNAIHDDELERPVILKNGFSATIKEWTGAAGYIDRESEVTTKERRVILCERGIRTTSNPEAGRFTPNIPAMLVAQSLGFPVIGDPSHTAGVRWMVPRIANAYIAAGADGLIIEVHNEPEKALSDAAQQLTIPDFAKVLTSINQLYLSSH